MPESRRETILAVLCALAAVLCFSSVPVMLKYLTDYLDAWTVNALRYGMAAMFWLPFVLVLGGRLRQRRAADPTAPRRSVWVAALVPTVPNLLGQIGWAAAPYYVQASTIGFVIRTSFVFTVALGFLFIPSERPLARRPLFFVGAAASLGGVFLMYLQHLLSGGFDRSGETVGFVILLATAAGYAAYAVCVGRFMAGYPLRLAFGVISLYTAASLAGLMLLFGSYGRLSALPAREWALLAASAFLGIAFGHVFFHRAIHCIGPVVTSGVTMIGPFSTYLLAMAFLGETMTAVQLAGGLAVVAGGLLLVAAKAQRGRPAGAAALTKAC